MGGGLARESEARGFFLESPEKEMREMSPSVLCRQGGKNRGKKWGFAEMGGKDRKERDRLAREKEKGRERVRVGEGDG
jgi:hypothetical protein